MAVDLTRLSSVLALATVLAGALPLGHVSATQRFSAMPTEFKVTGTFGGKPYRLNVTQTFDEDFVRHISSFQLSIGERNFAMPVKDIRCLKNPEIPNVEILSTFVPERADADLSAADVALRGGGQPGILVVMPFGALGCEDAAGEHVLAMGEFSVVFDQNGVVQTVEKQTAREVALEKGYTCEADEQHVPEHSSDEAR